MTDLQSRLQAAVGGAYRIEQELGGGGMSRVFLAEDVELGRRVVIKVLPPEMAAGVNQERFRREIQLAARLQHPHIVPLLSAGSADDLLYYMMPFIEGESLRAKLAREGELPVAQAVKILKDVVDALAYAHDNGVVHRDIKPDNVLLSGKHAVVTDFGVAKAVSEATGESSLTSMGVALGTPAYMAPEQAVADPHVDHRADIYAVGAMAYEMLTARPPFSGPNPQAVLSAHVTDVPDPATKYRETVPGALNELVMRCLAKKAADRWQRAEEMLPHLDAILTPSGGMTPTGTQPVAAVDYEAAARRAQPLRVAGLFALASVGALAIVYLLVQQLGLPDWVFYGAIGLLAVGFPVMLFTGHLERRRAIQRTTGVAVVTPQEGLQRWFTWRKALFGGGLAFGGLAVVAAVYMAMRLLGVGPVGTLVASGVLEERGRIVLADFVDRTGDSTLASALTEAFRVDLAQSRIVTLMPEGDVAAALSRMRRDPVERFDLTIARELAIREGAGAVVTGQINRAGTGFVLMARLVEPESGNELAAFRATASDETQIITAIDRLSRTMRERIGESFKTMREQPGLDRVTTRSLEALRKYSQGIRAEQSGSDLAEDLFEQAIALDSNFAMAWRKLAVVIYNALGSRSRAVRAGVRAYELRDRLPELERYQTTAFYYLSSAVDLERAISVYRAGLERFPDDPTLLANGAYALNMLRRYAEAESLAVRGHAYGVAAWNNRLAAQIAQGDFVAAESTVVAFARERPESPFLPLVRAGLAYSRRDFQRGDELLAPTFEGMEPGLRRLGSLVLGTGLTTRGRLAEADSIWRALMQETEDRGITNQYFTAAGLIAWQELRYRGRSDDALSVINAALERYPLDDLDPLDRPYAQLAQFFASSGSVERARQLMAAYEREVPEIFRVGDQNTYSAQAALALAEGRPEDAIQALRTRYRLGDEGFCGHCILYELARAFEAAGMTDSAKVAWDRAVSSSGMQNFLGEPLELPYALRRLGEIYEAEGNETQAVEYYNRFVELWQDADEELQPVVRDVRARIGRLVGEQ